MAIEAKRGCGYRKVGGLYLVAKGLGVPCDRLPYPLHVCPTCGGGIKQSRSYQFVERAILNGKPACGNVSPHHGRATGICFGCPLCDYTVNLTPEGKFGLMWVGEEHYPTPGDWTSEANKMGVSKRISAIPEGMEFGKTWVLVAHPKAKGEPCGCGRKEDVQPGDYNVEPRVYNKECPRCHGTGTAYSAAIFHAFVPQAAELIVTKAMGRQRWVSKLRKKLGDNLKLVEVPEDDKDHAARVRTSDKGKAIARAARKARKEENGEEE